MEGLKPDGEHYTGFLYAGLMIGSDGVPRVLEFNCRMGDPETQPILFRLQSDLVDLIEAALGGNLVVTPIAQWDPRPSLGVVLAAGGYPDSYNKGDLISGLDADSTDDDVKIFHAGTKQTAGRRGDERRPSSVRGRAGRLGDRRRRAKPTRSSMQISWDNMYCRRDIGYRAVARGV